VGKIRSDSVSARTMTSTTRGSCVERFCRSPVARSNLLSHDGRLSEHHNVSNFKLVETVDRSDSGNLQAVDKRSAFLKSSREVKLRGIM
jgi:hypothetical protein